MQNANRFLIINFLNKFFMKTINYIGIFFISCFIISCTNSNKKSTSTQNTLEGFVKVDGSSTVYPVTEAIAEEFRSFAPKVKVSIGISGTGGGFKKFSRGEIDISDASRPIKDKEKTACENNGISYVGLDVAYDGLAVIKNQANDWLDYITVEELNLIWKPESQKSLTHWNQIREEWPNEEIRLYGPGTASGTYDYFAEVICGKKVGTRGDYTASEDDNVLVQGVSGDKYALGFFGLAYYEHNKDKLSLVPVDDGNGAISPSPETVNNGTYTPLSRPIFIYVSDKSIERNEVVEFVRFYLSEAINLVSDVGYVPLSENDYKKQQEKFEAFLQ